jgi:hypothetical protein
LCGAGRLVTKDTIMLDAALVTMADSAKADLRRRDAAQQPAFSERELVVSGSWHQ